VPLRPAPDGRSTQRHLWCERRSALVPSLLCPCHSPTLRPWIAGRERAHPRDDVVVEGLWSRSLMRLREIRRQKHTLIPERNSNAERMSSLSLSGGASIRPRASQAGHHLSRRTWWSPQKRRKATRLGRPRLASLCGLAG